ncbi:collagen binding domain-containing protein [Streptomyces sp. NBC_00102]|uniref:MSCRAMM family protein n=1 Tax=Streptomyces sp. NBC_00102 TaxID=2975652 RepID=UPI002257242D|nr:SpaA isopeptide-forming pilin-related protein [Streptomyces sp. NBC_00102]MCX5395606.1 SpaA isopeptide-forming pilin-related protein [Streptomyces sp. NBC_00102]
MHARFVRSAAVVIAAAGTLTWAPVANAESSEPTPPSSAAPAETSEADVGSVEITTKDTADNFLPGTAFLLLDSNGQEAGRGQSDAHGKLTVPDLAPGVYRLKQTASGSPLHEVVADQDVIVTPGGTTRLTITDPYRTAKILLQVRDDKTGKLLPGVTANVGTGNSALLTLSTGAAGTASGELVVTSRSTKVWVKEVKALAGYDLNRQVKTITVGPGTSATVAFTNAKTGTHPEPDPSDNPTDKPTQSPPLSGKPSGGTRDATPSASGSDTPEPDSSSAAVPVGSSTPTAPTGSLAHTGADATPWLIGGAGMLIAAGGGALLLARRNSKSLTEN